MAYPDGYDVRKNQNYHTIVRLWKNRNGLMCREVIRNCFMWIRLDIAEHIRWQKNKI